VPHRSGRISVILKGHLSPSTIVLVQELERWNKLVRKVQESLHELLRAFAGEVGMSNELDALVSDLYNGNLPRMWRKLAPQTLKMLGSWIEHFQKRYQQYAGWIKRGKDPIVMWLSGLHAPASYLTALLQMSCRKKDWPLDRSTLYTKVTQFMSPKEVKEKPEHGCYVSGLYLEGASWDLKTSQLKAQDPKKLVVAMPLVEVIPVETKRLKLQNSIQLPVYVTQNRRNAMGVGLVFEATLPTNRHISHWILQGAALMLNTFH